MGKLTETPYRFACTGTLKESKAHKTVIIGHFGSIYKAISTEEMIEKGYASKFKIKAVVLKYPKDELREIKGAVYHDEIDWIISHQRRNKFICKLATSLKGNTLILFQFIEKHGDILYEMMKSRVEVRGLNHGVHYIHGGSDKDDREAIRKIMEENENQIVIASSGTMSTGANIKNLHNLIFASPSKARIKILQSVGRALRLHDSKDVATLYDIADDLRTGKKLNYSLQHFGERVKIYGESGFPYTISSFDI
jgi:superfamily II DNA or RNA helicase